MPDYLRRALRTLFQTGTTAALIGAYAVFVHPLTAEQTAAALGLGTVVVSFGQNLLEEQGTVPALLKGPTPPAAGGG